ncbi:MAG: tripartite tricarboxylate transporter substrate binding protein [Betaproteobacteria bacterium]|jgi:tripartite-type tricarboxylate transporter receptor subunit TctC|nr:tripartite tricarboxylate transporter substrate binding protein [Betaproteobacteria bacterium]
MAIVIHAAARAATTPVAAFFLLLGPAAGVANAAAFPERPVRVLAASAAGGGTDIIARLLAQGLTDLWGQQVLVDNRPGGGGVIATDIAAKAVPDGHTLLMQSLGITFAPALYKRLPFDLERDLAPVVIVGSQPFVLAVHPSVSAKSVSELVQLAKARPGELRFGSGGVSGAAHLGMELFRVTAGVDIVHVPYKGTGPGTAGLLAGEVQMLIAGIGTLMPHARAGRVRALGVTGAKRSAAAADMPTLSEAGLPGYEFDVWYGVFAPSKMTRNLLARVNADINATLGNPEIARRFAANGVDVIGGTLQQAGAYLRSELAKWTRVIREAGIRAD